MKAKLPTFLTFQRAAEVCGFSLRHFTRLYQESGGVYFEIAKRRRMLIDTRKFLQWAKEHEYEVRF